MISLYLLSVFIHITAACFWIGGMLFLPLVLLPGIKDRPDKIELLYATGMQFRRFGGIALVVLFLTGISNFFFKGLSFSSEFLLETSYGKLLLLKIFFFLFIAATGVIHDLYIGKKALTEMKSTDNGQFKMVARWTGRINLISSLAVMIIGIILSRGV